MELKDKIVVITGGSKGFGRSLAEAFLSEGSRVVICSHNKDNVESVAKEIGVLGIYADVRKEEDLIYLAEQTLKKFGKIDIWINNAGIWLPYANAEDFNMDEVKEMFDINVIGLMNGSRVALRYMKKIGAGTIISIISAAALSGRQGISTYSATKWAVNGFTKSILEENKNTGVSVLSVFPGGMKTEIFDKGKPDNFDDFMDPEDVARKVINNLKKENPEPELIIKREKA